MYKMIVFDYDGTLVARGKSLDDKIIRTITEWKERGIEVLIASGRTFRSLKGELKNLKLNLPLVSNNGNMLRMSVTDELIIKKVITPKLLAYSLSILDKFNATPIFHVDGYKNGYDLVLLNELDQVSMKYVELYENRYKVLSFDDLMKEDILSIVSYIDRNVYDEIDYEIKKFSNNVVTHHLTNGISYSGMMEIVGENSNKWQSVNEYAKSKNILKEDIIAIGDDTNDLSMIENAGVGVAMQGSPELLKNRADFVTLGGAEKYAGLITVNKIIQEVEKNEN